MKNLKKRVVWIEGEGGAAIAGNRAQLEPLRQLR